MAAHRNIEAEKVLARTSAQANPKLSREQEISERRAEIAQRIAESQKRRDQKLKQPIKQKTAKTPKE